MSPNNSRSKDAKPDLEQISATMYLNYITSSMFDFSEANGVSGWVYGTIFLISYFNSNVFLHRMNEWAPYAFDYENTVNTLLAYMMMLLLRFTYLDIHHIESQSNHRIHSDWVNRRYEIFLRVLILGSLLLGVGEVAHILTPIVDSIQAPNVRDLLVKVLAIDGTRSFAHSLYVQGSITVLYLQMVWNVGAIIFRLLEYWNLMRPSSRRELLVILCTMFFCLLDRFTTKGRLSWEELPCS